MTLGVRVTVRVGVPLKPLLSPNIVYCDGSVVFGYGVRLG